MIGHAESLAGRFQRATEDIIDFVRGSATSSSTPLTRWKGLSIGAMVRLSRPATAWP